MAAQIDSYERPDVGGEAPVPTQKAAPQTVWAVVITTKHGVDTEVYATEDLAKDGLLAFARLWWEELDPPRPMPADRDEAIRAYFDHHDHDWADVTECVVHTQNDS